MGLKGKLHDSRRVSWPSDCSSRHCRNDVTLRTECASNTFNRAQRRLGFCWREGSHWCILAQIIQFGVPQSHHERSTGLAIHPHEVRKGTVCKTVPSTPQTCANRM
jgi:hypothetical protein